MTGCINSLLNAFWEPRCSGSFFLSTACVPRGKSNGEVYRFYVSVRKIPPHSPNGSRLLVAATSATSSNGLLGVGSVANHRLWNTGFTLLLVALTERQAAMVGQRNVAFEQRRSRGPARKLLEGDRSQLVLRVPPYWVLSALTGVTFNQQEIWALVSCAHGEAFVL